MNPEIYRDFEVAYERWLEDGGVLMYHEVASDTPEPLWQWIPGHVAQDMHDIDLKGATDTALAAGGVPEDERSKLLESWI